MKTELLLQKLRTGAVEPSKDNYRSKQFIAFASGSLTAQLEVSKGWYAPAYRFVNVATGEETNLLTLPIVQVL